MRLELVRIRRDIRRAADDHRETDLILDQASKDHRRVIRELTTVWGRKRSLEHMFAIPEMSHIEAMTCIFSAFGTSDTLLVSRGCREYASLCVTMWSQCGPLGLSGMITDLMRVPDKIRDCVCFVEATWGGKRRWERGLRRRPPRIEGPPQRQGRYLGCHGKHCIMQNGQLPDELALRVNTRSG